MEGLHLFYCNKSSRQLNFYNLRIEAYLEIDRNGEIGFEHIETVSICSITCPQPQYVRFEHFFDTQSSFYSGYSSLEILKSRRKKLSGLEPVSQRDYERIRKVMFSIYAKHSQGLDLRSLK